MTYEIIPSVVLHDGRIKGEARCLYGDILGLSRRSGYCYAGNEHLAGLYGVTTRTIQRWIKQLSGAGHIKIQMISIKGKSIRKIFPVHKVTTRTSSGETRGGTPNMHGQKSRYSNIKMSGSTTALSSTP